MAAARDQAARILRTEAEGESEAGRDAPANMADQLRHIADEAKRKPPETSPPPAPDKPAPAAPAASAEPAKTTGRKRFVLMGVIALLALAAASYGVYYVLVGRFYISTDDAYVRANNTMLGARVAAHVEAIPPGDNTLVHQGDVIFRLDNGDYRIAVDAAEPRRLIEQDMT